MPNNRLPEMIAALAFTGLAEGSDAESEAYLRNWAQSHYHARGMRDRASVAGHAANVFKYLHLGRTDLAAQSIPSVLRRLEGITRAETELAACKADNQEMAAMIDGFLSQAERVETAVVALVGAPLDIVLQRVGQVTDEEERAAVYRSLAERASGERRTRLIEGAVETARMQGDPQARCHATLTLLPLLEGPDMALALDIALTGALNDLDEIPRRAWPNYVEQLAPYLTPAAAEALVEQVGAMADEGRVGALRTIAGIIEAIPMAFELAELVAPFNADSTPVRLLPQIAVAGEACRQWVTTAS